MILEAWLSCDTGLDTSDNMKLGVRCHEGAVMLPVSESEINIRVLSEGIPPRERLDRNEGDHENHGLRDAAEEEEDLNDTDHIPREQT